MARRKDNSGTVIVADDWSTTWRCQCGYGNAGRERCLMCGLPAPAAAQGTSGLTAEADVLPAKTGPQDAAGKKAGRTVAKIIVLNLILQVFELVIFAVNHVELSTSIRITMLVGLAYYTVCAVWVWGRSAELGVRAVTGLRQSGRGILVGAAEGCVVGGVAVLLLFAVLRLVAGRPLLDPTAALLTNQGSILALLVGIVLIAVAAPVVEEFVFRGFLAEAFRGRGKRAAVLISAVAFALAHLRLAQFRYYMLLGVVLALVYWRRGLVGSIATHATFNGMLILLAAVSAHGPAIDAHAAGFTVAVPQTYRLAYGIHGDDLVADGPVGARVEFAHVDTPVPPARELADRMVQQGAPFPADIAVDYTTIAIVTLPAGDAVSMDAKIAGRPGRVVALPTGKRIWIAVLQSDGSQRSLVDFDRMITSWRLPPTA